MLKLLGMVGVPFQSHHHFFFLLLNHLPSVGFAKICPELTIASAELLFVLLSEEERTTLLTVDQVTAFLSSLPRLSFTQRVRRKSFLPSSLPSQLSSVPPSLTTCFTELYKSAQGKTDTPVDK